MRNFSIRRSSQSDGLGELVRNLQPLERVADHRLIARVLLAKAGQWNRSTVGSVKVTALGWTLEETITDLSLNDVDCCGVNNFQREASSREK